MTKYYRIYFKKYYFSPYIIYNVYELYWKKYISLRVFSIDTMEQLLHYCWKHKIFPLQVLSTTDGREVEVLNPGIHNFDAGPDFSEAKIKIAGVVWVGNVELHIHSSDWYRHHHEGNPAYENIILHVVCDADDTVHYSDGKEIPQLQITIPEYVRKNYDDLLRTDSIPQCKQIIGNLNKLQIHSWMSALQVERMEMRTEQIMNRRDILNKNWEDTLFVTVARSFGFGKNGNAFEHWAYSIPMSAVGKHKDSLFQIEAIFFGQAGLLDNEDITDEYYVKLKKEYQYLRKVFNLQPIDIHEWKFLRLRPQNFPHIRIAQLAMLYYKQQLNLSRILNASTIIDIRELLSTNVSGYWKTHYTFGGAPSSSSNKELSIASKDLLIINAIAPIVFCYGKYKDSTENCDYAIKLLESIKPEVNSIIRKWEEAGIKPENAADSQALLHLHNNYCLRRDCLRCRFGYEYIRHSPSFLKENEE